MAHLHLGRLRAHGLFMKHSAGMYCGSILRITAYHADQQSFGIRIRISQMNAASERGAPRSALGPCNGLPVRLALSPGEAHDVRLAGKLLSRLKSGSMLLADRGYDADWIRELAMKKGAWANIPPNSNRSDSLGNGSCFGSSEPPEFAIAPIPTRGNPIASSMRVYQYICRNGRCFSLQIMRLLISGSQVRALVRPPSKNVCFSMPSRDDRWPPRATRLFSTTLK
jgi:transposase